MLFSLTGRSRYLRLFSAVRVVIIAKAGIVTVGTMFGASIAPAVNRWPLRCFFYRFDNVVGSAKIEKDEAFALTKW